MDVNQLREIKNGNEVSRVYRLPLKAFDGELMCFDAPQADNWYLLPERFLEGIDFASRFTGSAPKTSRKKKKPSKAEATTPINCVHLHDGKTYATDNKLVIEYDTGECDLSFSLSVRQVRLIKAFGTAPSQVSVGETAHFRWENGSSLSLCHSPNRSVDLSQLFDPHDWNDLHSISNDWQAQVIGHFSFKPVRDNDGLMQIYPDRITGGVFDNRPDTELRIETHTAHEVAFEQATLLNAIKIATEIKFVHDGDHSRLLFRGKNVRGIAASRYWVRP
ncbi:hypothetical protein [Aliiroseovarius marinus]|uniref:hypothetical protein n=1 Tax=Aliiroseovarius marinus TaxID=2500159 RepID=UPI003D7E4559